MELNSTSFEFNSNECEEEVGIRYVQKMLRNLVELRKMTKEFMGRVGDQELR